MATLTREELVEAWGQEPEQVSDELGRFSATARILSSNRPRLIDQHNEQWVGLYDGHVEVVGDTIDKVIECIDAKGYPREEVIVRYIDRNEKTLIL